VKEIMKEELNIYKQEANPQIESAEAKSTVETVKETVKEVNERRARESNMILFNAPEPNTNLKEERKSQDIEVVRHLCTNICQIDINPDEDISKAIRLGKKKEDGAPRPLLVVFTEVDKKKSVFRNLNKLKGAKTPYNKISVTHDMTPNEREESKKLHQEAKEKEDNDGGNWVYRVRGPPWARKIVRMQIKPKDRQEVPEEEGADAETV
jgi:hypothetical protein